MIHCHSDVLASRTTAQGNVTLHFLAQTRQRIIPNMATKIGQIARVLRDLAPDVVHAHGHNLALAALRAGYAPIWTIHGVLAAERPQYRGLFNRLNFALAQHYERLALAQVRTVTTVSPYVVEAYRDRAAVETWRVIENPAPPACFDLPRQPIAGRVLMPAAVIPLKDPLTLVRAAAQVRAAIHAGRDATGGENRAEHPERSGGVFPATQSKDAEWALAWPHPSTASGTQRRTPLRMLQFFRADVHAAPVATADENARRPRSQQPSRSRPAPTNSADEGRLRNGGRGFQPPGGIFRAEAPELEVRIAGPLDDAGYVAEVRAEIARLGLEECVKLLGNLDTASLAQEYSTAAVVALPSRQEVAPMVVVEAMAAGVPVIASAVGGVPYLVAEGVTGCTVPAGDPAVLAGALIELLTRPDAARRIGQAAQAVAHARFRPDLIAGQYLALYREMLSH